MRRAVQPLLSAHLRGLATSALNLQQAVPVLQEAPKKSSGFLANLFGLSSDRVSVPLTDPLPNVPQPSPVDPPSTFPPTEATTLPNGVKVVSEATYVSVPLDQHHVFIQVMTMCLLQPYHLHCLTTRPCPASIVCRPIEHRRSICDVVLHFVARSAVRMTYVIQCSSTVMRVLLHVQGPTATLGIYLDSGSVYETAETTGCSHLSEYMAYKATENRTTFRLVREVSLPTMSAFIWELILPNEEVLTCELDFRRLLLEICLCISWTACLSTTICSISDFWTVMNS